MKGGSGKFDGGVSSPKSSSNVLKRIKDIFGGGTPATAAGSGGGGTDSSSPFSNINDDVQFLQQPQQHSSGGGSCGNVTTVGYNILRSNSEMENLNEKFRGELVASKNLNMPSRIAYLKEIAECIRIMRIDQINVEQIWSSILDLLCHPDELSFNNNNNSNNSTTNNNITSQNSQKMINIPIEAQIAAHNVMMALIDSNYGMLGSNIKREMFIILQSSTSKVPLSMRVRALSALVKGGRDIIPFELSIVDLLIRWINIICANINNSTNGSNMVMISGNSGNNAVSVTDNRGANTTNNNNSSINNNNSSNNSSINSNSSTNDYNQILIEIFILIEGVLRHSQRIIAEGDMASLINNICLLSNSSTHIAVIECCLSFFDVVSNLLLVIPPPCISMIIASLSRTVNIDIACDKSCTTMQRILERYTHQGINSLCAILNDPHNRHTINLLRGAVFFLGMSVWGPQRIPTLGISPAFILPSLFNSLVGRQEIIAFEVILAIRRLIKKFGRELVVEWELIFIIIERIYLLISMFEEGELSHQQNKQQQQLQQQHPYGSQSSTSASSTATMSVNNTSIYNDISSTINNINNSSLAKVLRDTINLIEELDEHQLFQGSHAHLFKVSSYFFKLKTEEQILKIINSHTSHIHPSHAMWLVKMNSLLEFFFKKESRTKIRKRMIQVMKQLYTSYHLIYGEDIIENIILPALYDIHKDRDMSVRLAGLELMIETAIKVITPSSYHTLISNLDRSIRESPPQLDVARISLQGLISVFSSRFLHPACALTIEAWHLLLPHISHENVQLRKEVLHCIANLSSTKWYQMQYGKVSSPFIHCSSSNLFINEVSSMVLRSPRGTNVGPSPNNLKKKKPSNDGFFSIVNIWNLLVDRLSKETSFELYTTILEIISSFLKNRYILIGLDNEIDSFVNIIIKLLNEKSLGHSITDYQYSEGKKDIHYVLGFEILCNLSVYISSINSQPQSSQNIITTLFNGLCQKWSMSNEAKHRIQAICLNGLSICISEFPLKTTLKYIQNIAKALHQISTSSNTQKDTYFSILQYLNIMVSIPTLANQLPFETLTFIFKLLIQYFDRSKYSTLIVLVAFQCLIRWFTACSTSSRILLVKNIIKGLDGQLKDKNALLNEICIELLNRYIHTDFDPFHYPMRHSSPIFHEGLIKTWIQGCSLISIRTGKLGWAEVTHRKATGCVVWLMRFQNPSSNLDLEFGNTDTLLMNLPKQPYFRKEFSPTSPLSPSLSPISVSGEYHSLSPTANISSVNNTSASSITTITSNSIPVGASSKTTSSQTTLENVPEIVKSPTSQQLPSIQPENSLNTTGDIYTRLEDLVKKLELPLKDSNGNSESNSLETTLNLSLLPDASREEEIEQVDSTVNKPLISSQNLLFSPYINQDILAPSPTPFAEVHKGEEDNQYNDLDFELGSDSHLYETFRQMRLNQGMATTTTTTAPISTNNNNNSTTANEEMDSNSFEDIKDLKIPVFTPSSSENGDNIFLQSNLESPYSHRFYGSGENTPNPLSTLSKFYPPLPSFDDDEEILSFFSYPSPTMGQSTDSNSSNIINNSNNSNSNNNNNNNNNCKLNLNAQLLLHVVGSGSPPNANGTCINNNSDTSIPIEIPSTGAQSKTLVTINNIPSSNDSFSKQTEIFSLSVDDESPYLAPRISTLNKIPVIDLAANEEKIEKQILESNNELKRSTGSTKLIKSTSFTLENQNSSSPHGTDPTISPTPILEPTPTQSPIDISFQRSISSQSSFKPVSPLSTALIPKEGPIKTTSNKSVVSTSQQQDSTTQQQSITQQQSVTQQQQTTSSLPPIQKPKSTTISKIVPTIPITPNLNQFTQQSLVQVKQQFKNIPLQLAMTNTTGTTPIQIQQTGAMQHHPKSSLPTSTLPTPPTTISHTSHMAYHLRNKYHTIPYSPTSSSPIEHAESYRVPTLQKSNSSSTLPSIAPSSFSNIPNLFDDHPTTHDSLRKPSVNYDTTNVLSLVGGISPPHSPSPPPIQENTIDPSILDPSVVFYHLHQFSGDLTTEVKPGHSFERALSVLDHTFCTETYKIGIIYIAPGQKTEEEFLSNTKGSPRYHQFLSGIGEKVRIADRVDVYPGGLDRNGKSDGEFTIHWRDRISQIVFHVTTLMPNMDNDKTYTNKKRHIGNDYVNIIFSDSPLEFNQQCISGQFNFVNIIIYPLDIGWYHVEIKKKKEIPIFGPIHNYQIVSEQSLPFLVVQTAINANLISMQYDGKFEFISNLEERLKQIKTIKDRFAKEDDGWIDLVSLKQR